MYYFGNYKKLNRVVAKMFCKSVKAVLADTKVKGTEITNTDLESAFLFVRAVFTPESFRALSAPPNGTVLGLPSYMYYDGKDRMLVVSHLKGTEADKKVLKAVYNLFKRYKIFEYHPLSNGTFTSKDCFYIREEKAGNTLFEKQLKSSLYELKKASKEYLDDEGSFYAGVHTSFFERGESFYQRLFNHSCYFMDSAVNDVFTNYIFGLRVYKDVWCLDTDIRNMVRHLRKRSKGLFIARVDDCMKSTTTFKYDRGTINYLDNNNTSYSSGLYRFSLAKHFDPFGRYTKEYKKFLDLIPVPESKKEKLQRLGKKYLVMEVDDGTSR